MSAATNHMGPNIGWACHNSHQDQGVKTLLSLTHDQLVGLRITLSS